MIKKVQIAEKGFEGEVSEYLIVLNDDATDEDFYDLAWEYAIDAFAVDPNRRSHYRFTISDHLEN